MTRNENRSEEPRPQESYNSLRVALLMPVYNEGKTIAATVREIEEKVLSKMPNASLFIFEDGSKDNTKEVLSFLIDQHRRVFVYMTNDRKGYPRAVREALMSVDEKAFDYILFLDSDGQYDPDDFLRIFEVALNNSVDIVIGQRRKRTEPVYRIALSSGLRVIEKILFGPPCKDITSALRLIRVDIAKKVAYRVRHSRYSFWLEFTARATAEGFSMVEVPVNYRARVGEAKSNVYSVRKMPKVVYRELSAIFHTWWEYRGTQALKFAGVGLSGAAVILGLSYLFTAHLQQNYLLSTTVSIEASIIWAFVLNDKLTFAGSKGPRRWYARLGYYNMLSIGGLSMNELILLTLTVEFRMYYLVAEIVAIVVTFVFNYFTNLKWTWAGVSRPISIPLTKLDTAAHGT